jgi:hypothetical protein
MSMVFPEGGRESSLATPIIPIAWTRACIGFFSPVLVYLGEVNKKMMFRPI